MPKELIDNKDNHLFRKTLLMLGGFALIGAASGGLAIVGGIAVGGAIAIGFSVFALLSAGSRVTAILIEPEVEKATQKVVTLESENAELNEQLQKSLSKTTSLSTYASCLKSQQQAYQDEIKQLKQEKTTLIESLAEKVESEHVNENKLLDDEEELIIRTHIQRSPR